MSLLVFFCGLCFGSFLTLASYRMPRDMSIVAPGSRCTNCSTRLKALDLVPLLSWLVTKAKCRHCGSGVHWRYPLIEIITGLVFLGIYLAYGFTWQALILMLLATALLLMIIVDFEHYIIPDEVHVFLLPLGLLWHWLAATPWENVAIGTLGGLVLGLSLRYGYRFLRRREGLGLGDVKFLAVAGLWLGGVAFVPFILYAGLFGVATGLVWRGLKRGAYFPFGPALACSLFLCIVYPPAVDIFFHASSLWMP